jgi:hypothetical protein
MEQNKPAFAQRCEALANDEKACHEAYNNQYHKVRAEVGFSFNKEIELDGSVKDQQSVDKVLASALAALVG